MTTPQDAKTFGQYASDVFREAIYKSFLQEGLCRVDVVFGVYLKESLKSEARGRRGAGTRISVREKTPIWGKWQQFLRNDDNKTELFCVLAKYLVLHSPPEKTVIATFLDKSLSSTTST